MSEPEEKPPELTPLEKAQARRAERKAEIKALHDAQKAVDLEAITDLEIEHGDGNVGVLHLPYTETLPCTMACRCPTPAELKRFRQSTTPKHEKDKPDVHAHAEQLARTCRLYPDAETFTRLCEARPGACAQLGAEAVKLATGKDEAEGKG